MKMLLTACFLSLALLLYPGVPTASAATKDEKRAEVRAMSKDTLARLYKAQPSAKRAIEGAVGYAVFSNFGMKIFLVGGGSGSGLAVNNQTGKETFMKMVELQAGLGLGAKKFQVIFVFENQKALNHFIDQGWEFGSQTTASAKWEDTGGALQGAISVSPGVWMYQLTESGLAAEITAKGTKYYKNDELNR